MSGIRPEQALRDMRLDCRHPVSPGHIMELWRLVLLDEYRDHEGAELLQDLLDLAMYYEKLLQQKYQPVTLALSQFVQDHAEEIEFEESNDTPQSATTQTIQVGPANESEIEAIAQALGYDDKPRFTHVASLRPSSPIIPNLFHSSFTGILWENNLNFSNDGTVCKLRGSATDLDRALGQISERFGDEIAIKIFGEKDIGWKDVD